MEECLVIEEPRGERGRNKKDGEAVPAEAAPVDGLDVCDEILRLLRGISFPLRMLAVQSSQCLLQNWV